MRMTGGEAIVHSLKAHNINMVFGIPGVHNLALYEALCGMDGIQHIVARHEQGAAFMADGYARASGKIGVCLSTSGPAALNTLTSLGTAYSDSSPVLCLASQIPAEGIGKEKGYIHECRDQLSCFRAVTRWCERANSVNEIPGLLREAFSQMRKGRPRPVALEIPCDIMDTTDEATILAPAPAQRLPVNSQSLDQAAERLAQARRPVIWAGGGVITSGASVALQRVAERLQVPVFTTVLGKGALASDHPLSSGSTVLHPASQEFIAGCDVMLAVGTRFTEDETDGWSLRLPESLIHIDVDQAEIDRNYPASIGVVGDAHEALMEIADRLESLSLARCAETAGRVSEIKELKERILSDCCERAPDGVQLVKTLRRALPRETIVVSDLTVAAYWCRRLLDLYEPRTNIYPWGFCTLGFGLPAAIGAKAACPDRPVVVLAGDGGFLFNSQELAVAVQFDLPIVVIIFNDGGYGVLRRQQQVLYGRTLGADLVNPDFVALARAFGVDGQLVTSLDQLGGAVKAAIASQRITVIEVQHKIPWQAMEPSSQKFGSTS